MGNLNLKQDQFISAMERYYSMKIYGYIGKLVSITNVSLQMILAYLILRIPIDPLSQALTFLAAYFLTDFINGLVHMIMDHNEDYESVYGPLVASFHLHHQTPKYTKKSLPVVYFNETGAKIWLAPFLFLVLFLVVQTGLDPLVLHLLLYIGLLSSFAEVSHYLCHTSDSKTVNYLGRVGILLSREHHALHHELDNKNYAFLNGLSDPLINRIATAFLEGYKNTTDQHYAYYVAGAANKQR